jgi:hypothetical protein
VRRRQGSLTTAGNPHARRALVAGAWASRSPATVRRQCPRRRAKPPKRRQDSRRKAQVRRCPRSRRRVARGKPTTVGPGALARGLVGVLWAIAQALPVTPYVHKTHRDVTQNAAGCLRAWDTAQPRCGVTLGSVKRRGKDTRAETATGPRRRAHVSVRGGRA